MRPSLRVARAVAALSGAVALLAYAFAGTSVAEDATVQANGQNQFSPDVVNINPGDTVTWQYVGGFSHTVTSTSGNWSKNTPLGPPSGNIFTSYLFDRPGTYTYVCTEHGEAGMKGSVVVSGTVTPTKSPTKSPTARPTATRSTPAPTRSSSEPPSPTPSASSATPVVPSVSPPSGAPTSDPPQPSIAPSATGTPYLGVGGLTPPPPTGRGKGLPVMLSLLLIVGVGSAEIRALLANAPE